MHFSTLPRFFVAAASTENPILLNADERAHAKVLRLRRGDEAVAINGKGWAWRCRWNGESLEINQCIQSASEPAHSLCLAVAPPALPARAEWLIEKAVELGATQLWLLQTERTGHHRLKTERMERIAISALKQCQGLWLPIIQSGVTIADLAAKNVSDLALVAHCVEAKPSQPIAALKMPPHITLAVGPEGDFTAAELNMLIDNGFKGISLGPRRLRTETAAIALCAHWLLSMNPE